MTTRPGKVDYRRMTSYNFDLTKKDKALIGRRVRLIFTDDSYCPLKNGDEGTITYVSHTPESIGHEQPVSVGRDSNPNLMMITGKDQFDVL
jgi:hypothetical protein